jgi:ribosomal RNA-processing protein 9
MGQVRVWKLLDESQLVFKGHETGSIDCLAQLSEEAYVTGGEDGVVALWNVNKKKPVAQAKAAHGGTGITSVAVVKGSDLVASGGSDGVVRLWGAASTGQASTSSLREVGRAPLPGFVNGLQIATSGKFAVAAVGQEHRLGRWSRVKEGKNGLHVIKLLDS